MDGATHAFIKSYIHCEALEPIKLKGKVHIETHRHRRRHVWRMGMGMPVVRQNCLGATLALSHDYTRVYAFIKSCIHCAAFELICHI